MASNEVTPYGVRCCPWCECPIQRTPEGTIYGGVDAHIMVVHPERVPEWRTP